MNPSADTTAALQSTLEQRFGQAVDIPPVLAGAEELLRIAGQVSHRRWSGQPVGADMVRLLAACALAAPTKSYLQQADIVDVRDPAQRAAVCSLVPQMPWMRDAPALLVFCGNGRRFKRLFERRGMPFANDHLDGFFNPTVDAAMVMTTFIQAASAVGMVCCPISMLRDKADALALALDMPERVFPVAGLCVGYPAQTLNVNPRLPLSATLHTDHFDVMNDDAAVDEFDARYMRARSAQKPGAPEADAWSAERTRQYATPQRADWGQFVRAQDFDLS